MVRWILSRLKWLGLLAVIAPFAVVGLEYNSVTLNNEMLRDGVETNAAVEGGTSTKRRRSGTSFALNLTWTDAAGTSRNAEKVSISRSLADRVIKDDQLIVDAIRIRYLPDNPERKPVVAETLDGVGIEEPVKASLIMASYFVPTALLGGVMFWFLRRRERAAA